MQKSICLGLNDGTLSLAHYESESMPYYLGQLIPEAGGQKAITVTAVKNKSFEGEQV